jgi:hypothetical protein
LALRPALTHLHQQNSLRRSSGSQTEAPMREARSSPPTHRGARVIGTDAMRILLMSHEPSDGPERNQDNDDNPNNNAHQSSPAAGSFPLIHTDRQKKAPGTGSGASGRKEHLEGSLGVPILSNGTRQGADRISTPTRLVTAATGRGLPQRGFAGAS